MGKRINKFSYLWQLSGVQFQERYPSYHFDGDPDPTFLFDEVPDPTFHFTADPAPRQSDASLQQLVYRPPPAPFLTEPPRLHCELSQPSEPSKMILTLMRIRIRLLTLMRIRLHNHNMWTRIRNTYLKSQGRFLRSRSRTICRFSGSGCITKGSGSILLSLNRVLEIVAIVFT